MKTVLTIISIFSIYVLIDTMYTTFIVDEKGIMKKTLLKEKKVFWRDVKRIVKSPTSQEKKVSIYIFTNNETCQIPYWIEGYKELISTILKECSKSSDIFIDDSALKIPKE
ncbi:hypothetical protein R9X47_00155 [Wukongibacter baidiensis]|uniref:hypothetical protein n=1 Tax=Wukongibacter baidiensis TaxID=1723361 RepID=UPI003D7F7E1D